MCRWSRRSASCRAPRLGRADRDRPDPDLRAVLQHLVELRFPLLPRFPPLFEGRGSVRVEGVRHFHDDDRHRARRLSVRADRAAADSADRCDPAGVRQFRLCRSRRGRPHIDAVAGAIGLTRLFGLFGFDERMVRLLLAISMENISTGIARRCVRRLSSGIVSKRFTAVQYALLSSLTFLVGSLGRGIAGESIRYVRLCDGVPLDRCRGRFRRPVRNARMAARGRRRPARRSAGTAPKVDQPAKA